MRVPMAHSGDHYVLERPVIEVVVFEVKYQSAQDVVTLEQGFAVRDALRSATPFEEWRVEPSQTQEMMLQFGPSGPMGQARSSSGIKLSEAESGLEVSVFPTLASVQAKTYSRWSTSLKPIIVATLQAVRDVIAPVSRERVGLRYVNRFVDPGALTPRAWGSRLAPSLVATLADGPFADQIVGTQHQLELKLDSRTRATVRHGLVPDGVPGGPYAYLLDIDAFDTTTEIYSAEDASEVAEHLNRSAAELFSRSLGPEAEALGKRNVPAPDEEDG